MLEVFINFTIVIGNFFLVLVVDENNIHDGEKVKYLFHSLYLRGENTLSNPTATMDVWVIDAVLEEFLYVEYKRREKPKERESQNNKRCSPLLVYPP